MSKDILFSLWYDSLEGTKSQGFAYKAWCAGWEAALAQPEKEKESALCDADPRLLLGRSNNFIMETENRLCDIERRLAAIETQPAPPREKNNG